MNLRTIASCRLYGILDLSYVEAGDAISVARKMIAGGVEILQLRAKNFSLELIAGLAAQMHPITRDAGVPLIINDHLREARAVDGLHVGQDDLATRMARSAIGPGKVLGKSTHSIAQAVAAAAEPVDYIGFGPLFATPTKPDYTPIGMHEIQQVHDRVNLPIFCIGGIKLENLPFVLLAGARRVVIVSGILQAPDIAAYCREVKQMLPPV